MKSDRYYTTMDLEKAKDNKQNPDSPLKRVLCCVMPKNSTLTKHPHTSLTSQSGESLAQFITSYDDVINSFDDVTRREECQDLDLDFLKNVLESMDLLSLLKVHDRITTPDSPDTKSDSTNEASEMNEAVIDALDIHGTSAQCTELQNILENVFFKALLSSHDQIASKQFCPQLPEIAPEVDEDENLCVKVLTIIKAEDEPLGATIQRCEEDGSIKVARIMDGGAAYRSGLLSEGDEVKKVNGYVMNGHSPEELVSLLENTSGPVTLSIGPGADRATGERDNGVKVMAKFDYNPGEDPFTPCPEASLAFKRGDILDIVNINDIWWWQARKHGSNKTTLAGLIPSRLLTERYVQRQFYLVQRQMSVYVKSRLDSKQREDILTSSPEASLAFKRGDILDIVNTSDTWWWQARKHGSDKTTLAGLIPSRLLTERVRGSAKRKDSQKDAIISDEKSSRFSPKISKKSKKSPKPSSSFDYKLTSANCYEEIQPHQPTHKADRPIILISPKPEYAEKIRDGLLERYPEKFVTPVLCSNQPESHAKSNIKYFPKEEFDSLIENERVLEQEELNGCTVALFHKDLISAIGGDKTCIICCKPESINKFRRSDIKPYFLYFKPSVPERAKSHSMFSRKSKDTEAQKLTELNSQILDQYGPVFNQIVTETGTAETEEMVRELSQQLKHDISWIPIKWERT